MSALLPAAFYGLRVPGGDVGVDSNIEFPAAVRITMAAIDTSDAYEPEEGDPPLSDNKRCVLKIIRLPYDFDDEDDSEYDSEEEDQLKAILNGELSDSEDDSEEDEEANGGPSDPSKTKKARKEAAAKLLKEALAAAEDDAMVDDIGGKNKGKGISIADLVEDDDEDDDEDDEDDEESEIEEFVLCTLDPDNHYQQTLDFTIGEKEQVLFKVTGNYAIHLSGNYVIPVDDRPYDQDPEDEEYDLSPDEDELDIDELDELDELDGSEEDELDDLADPRLMEIDTDEEEAPKLVETGKKGKNKRKAEPEDDEQIGLDEIIGKSLKKENAAASKEEPKLSKKQQKKLKNNAGQAVAATSEDKPATESPGGKKVQFAKNLEQGPTGSTKKDEKKPAEDSAAASIKKIGGVTIDNRKSGKGPAAKKGSRVSMRYIGKLQDGKVFDSNKSGKPFSFKLGAGEVIQGWDIGIEGIQAGGERRLTVPADKAYGKKAMPGIPANSTLIFDVKCVEIK